MRVRMLHSLSLLIVAAYSYGIFSSFSDFFVVHSLNIDYGIHLFTHVYDLRVCKASAKSRQWLDRPVDVLI